ncbi:MAG: hypothetical protein Ct9H300mP32_4860 [Verrucomicrobiota bacterium]|nr:MAG: hypothetical protein Ct9H300mP32_4860 [Verrucomicrobiota bacterium]
MKGDITNGEKIFFRPQSTCATCHQINGRGIDFGPKLSGIGTKLGREALLLSILDPNAGISFGYEAWLLKMQNGTEALGLSPAKTQRRKGTLKLPGGISITYKAADITKRTQLPTSIMLPGLQATMGAQELVDMITYLHSLKQAKPLPALYKALTLGQAPRMKIAPLGTVRPGHYYCPRYGSPSYFHVHSPLADALGKPGGGKYKPVETQITWEASKTGPGHRGHVGRSLVPKRREAVAEMAKPMDQLLPGPREGHAHHPRAEFNS